MGDRSSAGPGGGLRYLAGEPLYADPAFLYPPGAAIVGFALAWVDPVVLSLLYAIAKVLLVVGCSVPLLRGWPLSAHVLVVVGVATCLPFVQDLMGNVNALLVVASCIALFANDRARSGVALGVVAALFAKPLLVPILFVLLVRRRRTAGAVGAGWSSLLAGSLRPVRVRTWPGSMPCELALGSQPRLPAITG